MLKYLKENETQKNEPITKTQEVKGDRKEPVRGFQKAMMKTMTEALVRKTCNPTLNSRYFFSVSAACILLRES